VFPGDEPTCLNLEVPGTFDEHRGGLYRPQKKAHAVAELSFSDGVTRWLIDTAGTPPREVA